jgi:multiple sugar transport system substrate-binding protein
VTEVTVVSPGQTAPGRAAGTRRGALRGAAGGAALAAAVVAVAPSCAGQGSGAGGLRQLKAPVTIEYWEMFGNPGASPRRAAVIQDFAEEQTEVRVKTEVMPGDLAKIKSAVAAGAPPDAMYLTWTFFADMLAPPLMVPLDPYLKGNREWDERRRDASPALLRDHSWRGTQYSVPLYAATYAMYYNRALFRQKGLVEPKAGWTWNDFVDLGRRGASPPDVWAYSLTRQDHIRWHLFGATNNSGFVSADGTKVVVNSPESVETTQWLADLVQRLRIATTDRLSPQVEVHFQVGQGLFEAQGSYRADLWRQNQIDFGVVPMPVKKTPSTYSASHHGVVFKTGSEDRQIAAIKLLLWATRPAVNARFCKEDQWNPMFGATVKDPLIAKWMADEPHLKVFADATATAKNVSVVPNQTDFYKPFNDAFRAITLGQMGVNDGLNAAAAQMQPLLDGILSAAR